VNIDPFNERYAIPIALAVITIVLVVLYCWCD